MPVKTVDDARKAGDVFLKKGVGAALITLGEAGALLHTASASTLIPAFKAGPVVETTGAGDAFNGGFADGDLTRRDARPRRCASAAPSPASR